MSFRLQFSTILLYICDTFDIVHFRPPEDGCFSYQITKGTSDNITVELFQECQDADHSVSGVKHLCVP